jgi:biopolymer transport protein ExbD
MEKLIEDLFKETSLESYEAASNALLAYSATATDEEKATIKAAILKKGEIVFEKSKESSRLAKEFIAQFDKKEVVIEVNGEKYPLKEWVTIKEYCKQFGIKNTMIVSNWISRKIVPTENVLHIKELNDIKLIKAIPYMQ